MTLDALPHLPDGTIALWAYGSVLALILIAHIHARRADTRSADRSAAASAPEPGSGTRSTTQQELWHDQVCDQGNTCPDVESHVPFLRCRSPR